MDKFNKDIRYFMEDVHKILLLSNDSQAYSNLKDKLQSQLYYIAQEYPQLQLNINHPSPSAYAPMNSTGTSLEFPDNLSIDPEKLSIDESSTDNCELISTEKWGYLEKKGKERLAGLLSPFQKRWCCIKDGILNYYEKYTDEHQKGRIDLRGYEARPAPSAIRDLSKKNQCFELVCPGRKTFQFIAPSPKEMHLWIAAIDLHSQVQNSVAEEDSYLSDNEGIYEFVEDKQNAFEENGDGEDLYDEGLSEVECPGDWYIGLWDCKGSDDKELSFRRGDMIHILNKDYDNLNWWVGELDGYVGLVPKNYLMEAYEYI